MSNKKLFSLLIGAAFLFVLGRFFIPMLMSAKDTGAVIIAVSIIFVFIGSAVLFINNKLNQLKKEETNEDA